MRRFRRRRSTQIWLPTYGNANDDAQTDAIIGTQGLVNVTVDGGVTIDAFPVTFDDTKSAWQNQFQNGNQTLHDIATGQEWKLLRVVGKVHLSYSGLFGGTDPSFTYPYACEAAAGLIVLRTDEEGNLETDIEEHNPLAQESADDPWIWRRKWILSGAIYNKSSGTSFGSLSTLEKAAYFAAAAYPSCNANYGSVADGPHIDQKTRRRIGREERLYWMLATRIWDPYQIWSGATQFFNAPGSLAYNIDNRFVGRLSSRMGNRNNASR